MNLSMKWLADYVDCGVSVKEFCAGMTMSGSKVETYETEGDAVKNVIVGKLVSITPHENSDHLQVCQVDVDPDRDRRTEYCGGRTGAGGDDRRRSARRCTY